MWAGRDLQEIQNSVDSMNAAPLTPLPYPSMGGPPGPPPVSAISRMSSSEPGATSDDGSDDDDDDDGDDDEGTIYDIPGFPLRPRPSSAGVIYRGKQPQSDVRSPQIVPASLDARTILNPQLDAPAQDSQSMARGHAKAGAIREKPASISILTGRPQPSRDSTAGYSETSNTSNASTTFLNSNTSQNATAQIMTNPEIHVSDDSPTMLFQELEVGNCRQRMTQKSRLGCEYVSIFAKVLFTFILMFFASYERLWHGGDQGPDTSGKTVPM
jgi:hypothetical protein